MSLGKRIFKSSAMQSVIAFLGAMYVRLVRWTGRFEVRRADVPARFWARGDSFICTNWHGQNLVLPAFWHNWREIRVLTSKHGDGEVIARLVGHFGAGAVRGSGAPKGEEARAKHKGKGGAAALRAMIRTLGEDISIGMTADVPPGPARRAGEGIIVLARLSGRPIVPMAGTTRAAIRLNNWSKITINLPFSKGAVVWGDPIYVPRDADAEAMEAARQQVEDQLNKLTQEAERLVGYVRPSEASDAASSAPSETR